jgi:hypothetical protein
MSTGFEITGQLVKLLDVEKGVSKANKEWQKQCFIIEVIDGEHTNQYCFEVFGTEKVENLSKYQKVGDELKVSFNIKSNEWKGKYYTSLSAWRIDNIKGAAAPTQQAPNDIPPSDPDEQLPF